MATALGYGICGGAWILYSDAILLWLGQPASAMAAWGSVKGLAFIAATSALIFVLRRNSLQSFALASQRLQTTRATQISILDAVPDILVVLDRQGRVEQSNRQARAVTGYAAEDICGRAVEEFVPPFDRDSTRGAVLDALDGRERKLSLRLQRKDRTTVPYEFLAVPRRHDGRVSGVIVAGHDISEQVRSERALKRSLGGVKAMLEQSISAIAALIEQRDPYLSGHQERVTTLALAIAGEMRLDEDRREGLRFAGICHDVGKIHVPAEILSKPGRITDAEFAMIRAHAEIGFEILDNIDFPWPVAEIVRQHHERYDGSGYPRGLSGDNILLEARILAVADTVEAMTSHRPYRPGLGLQAALAEIRAERGTRYDPAVVDACLAAVGRPPIAAMFRDTADRQDRVTAS